MTDAVNAVFKEVVEFNLAQAREYAELIVGLGEVTPKNAFDANALNAGLSVALATLSYMIQAREDGPPPIEIITAIGLKAADFELMGPAVAVHQQTQAKLNQILNPPG